jgi:hypothetical protein
MAGRSKDKDLDKFLGHVMACDDPHGYLSMEATEVVNELRERRAADAKDKQGWKMAFYALEQLESQQAMPDNSTRKVVEQAARECGVSLVE